MSSTAPAGQSQDRSVPFERSDPFAPASLADPYAEFARFVRSRPVCFAPTLGYWVVSRFEDARRVLREHETFSASNTVLPLVAPCPRAGQAL
ncbi:MAG: hypothetical protein ACKV2O_15285 [Acidimicrobiales bacterium]